MGQGFEATHKGRSLAGFDLPDDCHPKIRSFVEYWLKIGPKDRLPGRQHLDPADITGLLANLWLVDVEAEPQRFKYRLVGTKVVDYLGLDPTGEWMDEVLPHLQETFTFRDLVIVADEGRPRWRRGQPTVRREKDYKVVEQVSLPLAKTGKAVDMVMNLTVFLDAEGREC